ncbi:hypothetical protein [Aphanothece minutissima]|uniref:Uncharacterized protein n=1 Tax=Aphanothece cf. minutissima CCALA 015 TaxID=2107695 RepID=A0ABX5F8E4_9CHRO|nr:hypothetical protein [Aphanothece minutissima]PSB37939.1 hypothetical protein C7B81_07520 [Aphanothece cf. minutissima CCALA 015]
MTVSTDRTTQTEARLDQLRALHLQGGSAADLRQLCRSWGLSDRQRRRLMAALRSRLSHDWQEARPQLLEQTLARLEHVYRLAVEKGNLAVALGAINSTAKLTGLDPQATALASAQLLEAIDAAPLSREDRLGVHLSLACRGLLPLPEMKHLSTPQLKAIAAGEHAGLPGTSQ